MEEIQWIIGNRAIYEGLADAQFPAHHLRYLVRDGSIEVVLARRYPIAAIVVEREVAGIREPDIFIDGGRVWEQTQGFRLNVRDPPSVGAANGITGGQCADTRRVVDGLCISRQGVCYLRVGVG